MIHPTQTRLENSFDTDAAAWELRSGKTDKILIEITNKRGKAYNWLCSGEIVIPLYYKK